MTGPITLSAGHSLHRHAHGAAWSRRGAGRALTVGPATPPPAPRHRLCGGAVGGVQHGGGHEPQFGAALRGAAVGETLVEVGQLLRVAVHPVLVGRRLRPALLGADLLHHVHVVELLLARVVGLQRVDRIQVAARAVVVGEHLQPVVDAAEHDLGGEHVGHGAVGERHVQRTAVLDVLVVGAQVAGVTVAGQAGQRVHARAHRGRADRRRAGSAPLLLLQEQDRGQRMARLAHQRAAAGVAPDAVQRRVRAGVRLLAGHAQDLRLGLAYDLRLLLHGRREHPVLGVAERRRTGLLCRQHAPRAGHRRGLHLCARRIRLGKAAGERLLDNRVHPRCQRRAGNRLVGSRRCAHVHHVHLPQQFFQARGCGQPVPRRKRIAPPGVRRVHRLRPYPQTGTPAQPRNMKLRREPAPCNPRSHYIFSCSHPVAVGLRPAQSPQPAPPPLVDSRRFEPLLATKTRPPDRHRPSPPLPVTRSQS